MRSLSILCTEASTLPEIRLYLSLTKYNCGVPFDRHHDNTYKTSGYAVSIGWSTFLPINCGVLQGIAVFPFLLNNFI